MINSLLDELYPEIRSLLYRPLNPFAAPEVTAFEAALCQVFRVKEAVAVSSGTAALHCALAAIGVGPGDEVLVPSLSVVMSVLPVTYQRARPVFVDCASEQRIDFDYDDLERKVSPRTKAILPVYLWGCPYNMDRLTQFAEQHHLAIIEDACQAHGSAWNGTYLGTWGRVGCFSMKAKLLSTEEGGFLLTNDSDIAQECRTFRTHYAHPSDPALSYQHVGNNYRLTQLQAWLAHKQVVDLDGILASRYEQAVYLMNGLADMVEPYQYLAQEQSNLFNPVFFLDEVFVGKGIAQALAMLGVANSVGTFGLQPVQQWPIFAAYAPEPPEDTPHTRQLLSRALAISLLPQHTKKDLDRMIASVRTTIMEAQK